MHVPFARQQDELVLGKLGVDHRQRNAMKREVPRRIPRILPFVGHGDDVGVVEVRPFVVAPMLAFGGGGGWPGSPLSHSGTS